MNDGVKNNQLAADEILTRIRIPRPSANTRMAYQKLRVRGAIDFPMLNMALSFIEKDGDVSDMQLVFSAIAARPRRIKRLPSGPLNAQLVDAVAEQAFKSVRPLTNINGDVVWRREMAPTLVRQAFASLETV